MIHCSESLLDNVGSSKMITLSVEEILAIKLTLTLTNMRKWLLMIYSINQLMYDPGKQMSFREKSIRLH